MGRIQEIRRQNGSTIRTIVLPQDIIDATGWKKGDSLAFEVKEKKVLLTREL